MSYYPDGWFLVQINNREIQYYKIFGSWAGGYLDGDAWRMNSGVVKCEYKDNRYLFYGASGSIYSCHEESYGRTTAYNGQILQDIIQNSHGTIQAIPFLPDNLTNYKWGINE